MSENAPQRSETHSRTATGRSPVQLGEAGKLFFKVNDAQLAKYAGANSKASFAPAAGKSPSQASAVERISTRIRSHQVAGLANSPARLQKRGCPILELPVVHQSDPVFDPRFRRPAFGPARGSHRSEGSGSYAGGAAVQNNAARNFFVGRGAAGSNRKPDPRIHAPGSEISWNQFHCA